MGYHLLTFALRKWKSGFAWFVSNFAPLRHRKTRKIILCLLRSHSTVFVFTLVLYFGGVYIIFFHVIILSNTLGEPLQLYTLVTTLLGPFFQRTLEELLEWGTFFHSLVLQFESLSLTLKGCSWRQNKYWIVSLSLQSSWWQINVSVKGFAPWRPTSSS